MINFIPTHKAPNVAKLMLNVTMAIQNIARSRTPNANYSARLLSSSNSPIKFNSFTIQDLSKY